MFCLKFLKGAIRINQYPCSKLLHNIPYLELLKELRSSWFNFNIQYLIQISKCVLLIPGRVIVILILNSIPMVFVG